MPSYGTVISYPIPAYQNVEIQDQFYQPGRFVISAITRGVSTTVTTSVDHNYVIGQQVRLLIPPAYGAYGLNKQQGIVISIPAANQVVILIDSNNIDAFVSSPSFIPYQDLTPPQIMAIGDVNSGPVNSSGRSPTQTFIDGSFIDISPN